MNQADLQRLLAEGLTTKELGVIVARAFINKEFEIPLPPIMHRYVVIEYITDRLTQEDFDRFVSEYDLVQQDAINWRDIPIGTILAVPVRDGSYPTNSSKFVYPFFQQHLQLPIKPGEHVWVFYETFEAEHARPFYFGRITEPRGTDDLNHTHANRQNNFKANPSELDAQNANKPPIYDLAPGVVDYDEKGEPYVHYETVTCTVGNVDDAYVHLAKNTVSSKRVVNEPVPRYKKRPGDFCVQGSNNTLICLGTDRNGPAGEQPLKNSGAIDIVVGRGRNKKTKTKVVPLREIPDREETDKTRSGEKNEDGDPDFRDDGARVYLSMSGDVESKFQTSNSGDGAQSTRAGTSASVKADHVTVVARKSIKLVVKGIKSKDGVDSESDDKDDWISLSVNAETGDVVIKPAKKGYVRLGSANANKAILTTSANAANGQVLAPPIVSTMGGAVGIGPGQGEWATKVLVELWPQSLSSSAKTQLAF